MTSTSIGRGPAHGRNENQDGDPTHTTLGEGAVEQKPPTGSEDATAKSPTGPNSEDPQGNRVAQQNEKPTRP